TARGSASDRACACTRRARSRSRSLFSFWTRGAAALRGLDRLAEGLHQVDDLGLLVLWLGQRHAVRLRPDQLEKLLAVGVVVLARVEFCAEALDERVRHLELGRPHLGLTPGEIVVERLRAAHLV